MAQLPVNNAMAKKKKKSVPRKGRTSLSGEGITSNRTVRVSDEEWESWRLKAERARMKLSEWIRDRLNRSD